MHAKTSDERRVSLLQYTPNPERVVATAAKLCYTPSCISNLQNISEQSIRNLIQKIMEAKHLSVLEHVSFTFGIEGVSRALTHQLVRHRLASYSQQSQRYVAHNSSSFDVIIPPSIRSVSKADDVFTEAYYNAITHYNKLLDLGVPKEDARYVLPNASETKIIVTMNARELLHFFSIRCCNRAQWEIRGMAFEMLRLVIGVAPNIFRHAGPGCVFGECSEGAFCCGAPVDMTTAVPTINKEHQKPQGCEWDTSGHDYRNLYR